MEGGNAGFIFNANGKRPAGGPQTGQGQFSAHCALRRSRCHAAGIKLEQVLQTGVVVMKETPLVAEI